MQEWMFGQSGSTPYSGTWLQHTLNSSYRVFGGFIIAAIVGVTLGCLIGWFRLVSDLIDPIIQMMRPIPITSWVPFAVIFFGIRYRSEEHTSELQSLRHIVCRLLL